MALINCKECSQKISDKAKTCPHCGFKKPSETFSKIVLTTLLLIFFIIALGQHELDRISKLSPEDARAENIKQSFNRDGSHKMTTRLVKMRLKDPDSFQHINTSYVENENHLDITMTYRAKNSFGGYTQSTIKSQAKPNGELINAEFQRN